MLINQSNFLLINKWHNYFISSDNNLLSNDLINEMLHKFWDEIMNNIDNKMVILLFRIQFEDQTYRTIGNLQKINKNDFNILYKLLTSLLTILSDDYKNLAIINIIFSYKIIDTENKTSKIDNNNNNKSDKLPTFKFYGYNLPLTMDITKWGTILSHDNNHYLIQREKSNLIYDITIEDLWNKIQIKDSNNLTILTFKDIKDINNQDKSSFNRIINNQTYHFNNGKLILKTLEKSTNILTPLKVDKKLNHKFITLDIETQSINNVMTPYCISFFDGKNFKSFYLSDYKNSQEMLIFTINSLLKRKYNGYKIYVHNLSNFDGIFLLKILSSIDNIKVHPILKDGKMINIKMSYDNINAYQITFRDSYLILPSSLNKLARQFNVTNKGIFPYNFVNDQFNKNINLNYIGKVPPIKYFVNISIDQYNDYIKNYSNNWSLKNETINYCNQDCISLYQIIHKFNSLIFEKYQLNIHKFPTLPSLAFGIYRTHYLIDYPIPLLSGQIFNDISKSFTGGSTEMFIPFGENIYAYDVNSLYPYVMNNFDMPIGNIKFFEGNILEIEDKPFGFFECKVTSPKTLKHPILQTKIDSGQGIRTLSPLGSWIGIYFSEEIYNAIKYGYKIEILRGYTFDKTNIFKEYINDLYEIKKSSNKDDPMYLISKLLMNSLYGRFGMNEILFINNIIDDNDLYNYIDKYTINNIIPLDNNKILISYFDNNIKNNIMLSNETHSNISIGIASAITAYSRIHMTQFKNNLDYNLYYSDTDSIYIDKELSNNFISNNLGQMKLEYKFNEAAFLAPKVYGGLYFDNNKDLKSITKVKGYKNKLDYYELKSLLNKDKSLSLPQEKWFKDIKNGNITIKNQLYNLKPTENKRKLIYNNKIF
jgi:hypothetical protein